MEIEEIDGKQHGYMAMVGEMHRRCVGGRNAPKRYTLHTFGCQMNENDSERLAGMLSQMGYEPAENRRQSDLIIFNTCCVRENAELKVYGHLGALKKLKKENPEMVIAVCGCMMQQPDVVTNIRRKYPQVDLVFGTYNLYRFPELLYEVLASRTHVFETGECEDAAAIQECIPVKRSHSVKAYVTVMYGCNNFCSYCIVPYVRGRERSRRKEDVIDEIGSLAASGYKEVMLLGQNVNSYGMDMGVKDGFASLLRDIEHINGIERVRFMTSHPKDLSENLVNAMHECKKVCRHLHLPLQAGSDEILRRMNRKYTRDEYAGLIGRIRESIPGIALTTDIIVGFPGETEKDFGDTLDIVERIRFDAAFTFLYSKRTGTPAAEEPEQVPGETMKDRFERLLELQNAISYEINGKLYDTVQQVLVEGRSRNDPGMMTGRTGTNKIVNFKGKAGQVGQLVDVRIDGIQTWSLMGKAEG